LEQATPKLLPLLPLPLLPPPLALLGSLLLSVVSLLL
jgi:hypothetical protein